MRGWNIAEVSFCPAKVWSSTLQARKIFLKHSFNYTIPLNKYLQQLLCIQNTTQTPYKTYKFWFLPSCLTSPCITIFPLLPRHQLYQLFFLLLYQAYLTPLISSRPLLAHKAVFTQNKQSKTIPTCFLMDRISSGAWLGKRDRLCGGKKAPLFSQKMQSCT